MIAIAILFALVLTFIVMLLNLGRVAMREARRGSQHTNFQQWFFNRKREQANWQAFICALSAGTLPELQENLR